MVTYTTIGPWHNNLYYDTVLALTFLRGHLERERWQKVSPLGLTAFFDSILLSGQQVP